MIILKDLKKKYNGQTVLDIKNLSIDDGDFLGLVGNNGAGKTTLLRLILDLIKADNGEIYSGNDIISKSEQWKEYTSSYLDEGFLINFLTPEEFFYFVGNCYGYNKIEINNILKNYNSFFNDEILDKKGKFIREFSSGNKQKIGIASALINNPRVLLLDEPFNSLDPTSQIFLKRILVDYQTRTNSCIILSSHNLNHIADICNRIVLIEKGTIIYDLDKDSNSLQKLEKYFLAEG